MTKLTAEQEAEYVKSEWNIYLIKHGNVNMNAKFMLNVFVI